MGALFLWLILLAASSFLLKAGSYVFAWPLLFALIGVNILIRLDEIFMEELSCYSWFCHPGISYSITGYLSL